MAGLNHLVRAGLVGLACVGVAAGCSTAVSGTPRAQSARDGAPSVASADLAALLVSDAQANDLVGAAGLSTYHTYTGITPPAGESFSEPECAQTLFNTMYTGYDGTGYTGAAGRKLGQRADRMHIDQGVVSYPDADAALRFVVRTVLGWHRCADVHLSDTEPPPDPGTVWFTLGFPSQSGDVATVVNTAEGGEGYACAHAIVSRSNVVIDVYVCGKDITAAAPVALVNAIANKMPHQ